MTADLWNSIEVEGVRLPVCVAQSYPGLLAAWREVDVDHQKSCWMFGAIAVRLERAAGGRHGTRHANAETAIQKFCRDLNIHRQSFQRYSRTYALFAERAMSSETRTPGVTRYMSVLPFKHHEVAARHFSDPERALAALTEAHDKRWSANELARQLEARTRENSGPKPFSLGAARHRLFNFVFDWPLSARRYAPAILRDLAERIEHADGIPTCPRDVMALAVGDLRDVEEIAS